jgi:lipoate-protein ligase A
MGSRLFNVPEMEYLDLTFPDPADNLACDEALLDSCDRGESAGVLRFWEPQSYFVVVGYSNRDSNEIRLEACRKDNIPILRRHSGGGTVLLGPGCLIYAVVLRVNSDAPVLSIRETNRFVMERHRGVIERLTGSPTTVSGFTDLVMNGRKVSGNAQYRRRNAVLFHGTFLLDFDISMIEYLLETPSVAPDYRDGRSHIEFLATLGLQAQSIKDALRHEWNARSEVDRPLRLHLGNYRHLDPDT